MKKTGVLNQNISNVIAGMGHTETLVIGDAGLPIPACVERIDLALKKGVPGFLETVEVVAQELQVEKIIIAVEMCEVSPQFEAGLKRIFPDVPVEKVSHEIFKRLCSNSKAVIRTGEFTPYGNVILVSGVVF